MYALLVIVKQWHQIATTKQKWHSKFDCVALALCM